MSVLLSQEAKMVAAACLLVCLLLVLRAFSINPNTGRRRFGVKSMLFLVLTVGLIAAIQFVQKLEIGV